MLELIVRSNVTTESQPAAFVSVCVAVLLLDVYVLPSIQVYESHAVIISVPVLLELMVKFNVTTESQPAAFVKVYVAVLLLAVYVFPSIQVYESQAVITSVPVLLELIVRSKVTTLSQPAAFVKVYVAVLLFAV